MPLNVEVIRDGEVREDLVWDYPTLSAVLTAAFVEDKPETELPSGRTMAELDGEAIDFSQAYIYGLDVACVTRGVQTLEQPHSFYTGEDVPHDPVCLEAGDTIRMWRSGR